MDDLLTLAERFAESLVRHAEATRERDRAEADWLAALARRDVSAPSRVRVGPWEITHDGPSRTWSARLVPPIHRQTGGEQ